MERHSMVPREGIIFEEYVTYYFTDYRFFKFDDRVWFLSSLIRKYSI